MKISTVSLSSAKLALTLLVCFLLQVSTAQAQDGTLSEMPSGKYDLDLGHASVLWKVSHFGFSMYPGRFTDFAVDLDLDTANFSNSSVAVEIQTSSIQTAYPYPEKENFDEVLAKDWFKAEEYPTLSFASTAVSALEGNAFNITGDLTMLGQTKSVVLTATLNKASIKHPFVGKPVIGFSATTVIDRTQWGLSKFAPSIGNDVEITIEGEFSHGG